MIRALREHWPEYLCEAAELGLFMISAALFTMLLWHPSSPVFNLIPNTFGRRMLTGIAMGSTAIALVFSPLGKRSGAHFNPAVTLTFWRLGKVKNWDAFFYVIAQFIGGISGVLVVALLARMALSHQPCSDVRSGFCRSSLDRALDLLHCASACNAAGRARLSTNEASRLLCQVSSPQHAALHLQLPLFRIAGTGTNAEASAPTRYRLNEISVTLEHPGNRTAGAVQHLDFRSVAKGSR